MKTEYSRLYIYIYLHFSIEGGSDLKASIDKHGLGDQLMDHNGDVVHTVLPRISQYIDLALSKRVHLHQVRIQRKVKVSRCCKELVVFTTAAALFS